MLYHLAHNMYLWVPKHHTLDIVLLTDHVAGGDVNVVEMG